MRSLGRRSRFRRTRRQIRLNRTAFRLIALLLVVVTCLLLLDAKLRPNIRAAALLQSRSLAVTTVNEAAVQLLAKDAINYQSLVTVNTNAQGDVTSITSDILKMNLLKSELAIAIDAAISAVQNRRIPLPLSNILGLDLLAGRGPSVKLSLSMTGESATDFTHEFDSAGVNQTRHRVMLHISSRIYVMLPGNTSFETVETSFCVAETVIVGAVPNLVTGIGSLTQ